MRSLIPREHGAYVQLGIPLVAVWIHAARLSSVFLGIAACLAFVAHEPLLVMIGARGDRARRADASRAKQWFAIAMAGALLTGIAGLLLSSRAVMPWVAAGAALTTALIVLAKRRLEHTLVGELVACAALTLASAIASSAGSSDAGSTYAIWLGWFVGFGTSVLAVHHVLARHRRRTSSVTRGALAGAIAIAVVVSLFALPRLGALVAAPLTLTSGVVALTRPHASRLRMIGIAMSIAAAGGGTLAILMS